MIIYRKGDLLEAFEKGEVNVIGHGVNCKGVMGSGIAKQIKDKYPLVLRLYEAKFFMIDSDWDELLGNTQYIPVSTEKGIYNLFIQLNYGRDKNTRYCSYDAIDSCFYMLEASLKEHHIIGIPKIGAGLANGDWNVIEAIINSHFKDRDIYVYTLE